jgi:hypothetical protein
MAKEKGVGYRGGGGAIPTKAKNIVILYMCTVKKVSDFPVPSQDVTNQTLPENLFSAGGGKIADLFYSVLLFHYTGPVHSRDTGRALSAPSH